MALLGRDFIAYLHFLFVASVTTVSAKYPKIESDAILDDGEWLCDKLLAIFQLNSRVSDMN